MEKVRYMISDAATMAGVESHVLRYWEDELDLTIPRNEMGHRYYTRENILEFQKIKSLKEQGYQLKAIRTILHNGGEVPPMMFPDRQNGSASAQDPVSPADRTDSGKTAAVETAVPKAPAPLTAAASQPLPAPTAEDRMEQFRELMSDIVGQAISRNNDELSQIISQDVHETVLKEMNYLFREQDAAEEERFKKLDAALRSRASGKRSLFSRADKPVKEKPPKLTRAERAAAKQKAKTKTNASLT